MTKAYVEVIVTDCKTAVAASATAAYLADPGRKARWPTLVNRKTEHLVRHATLAPCLVRTDLEATAVEKPVSLQFHNLLETLGLD